MPPGRKAGQSRSPSWLTQHAFLAELGIRYSHRADTGNDGDVNEVLLEQ